MKYQKNHIIYIIIPAKYNENTIIPASQPKYTNEIEII